MKTIISDHIGQVNFAWELSDSSILLPDPAAMAKDDVEAEVEASVGGSRFDGTNGSEALG